MRKNTRRYLHIFSIFSRFFWLAAVLDSAYILRCALSRAAAPAAAIGAGLTRGALGAMTEAVAAGVAMLLLASLLMQRTLRDTGSAR